MKLILGLLLLFFLCLFSYWQCYATPVQVTTNPAVQAAIDAAYIQLGLQEEQDLLLKAISERVNALGCTEEIALGVWVYRVYKRRELPVTRYLTIRPDSITVRLEF